MKVLKIGQKGCSACQIMGPRWKEIEKENPWLKTEYFEFKENPEIDEKYSITQAPVFIFLDKNGNEIARYKDIIEKEELVKAIEENRDK